MRINVRLNVEQIRASQACFVLYAKKHFYNQTYKTQRKKEKSTKTKVYLYVYTIYIMHVSTVWQSTYNFCHSNTERRQPNKKIGKNNAKCIFRNLVLRFFRFSVCRVFVARRGFL